MSEKKIEVTPKKVLYQCDECGEGWLFFLNAVKQGIDGKPLFSHQCNKCKKIFDLKKQYPAVEFIEVRKKIDIMNN